MRRSLQLLQKMDEQKQCFLTDVIRVWRKVLDGVDPNRAVRNCTRIIGKCLIEKGQKKTIHVIGFGKAALGMARGLEDIIGGAIHKGILSVPFGSVAALQSAGRSDLLPKLASLWEIHEGAKLNQPDKAAADCAERISQLVKSLQSNDVLIALISGGGSALLPCPKPPLTFEHKVQITKMLQDQGAHIQELNTIRKKLSLVKGGGLARLAAPSQVISLIISDVIGDKTGCMVASGPTFLSDIPTSEQCIDILKKYNVENELPNTVMDIIKAADQWQGTTPEPVNMVICDNESAINAAMDEAITLGWHPLIVTSQLCGDAREVGVQLQLLASYCSAQLSRDLASKEIMSSTRLELVSIFGNASLDFIDSASTEHSRICLICGGETTVRVKGSGRGGRNQELALAWLLAEHRNASSADCCLLSCGTDGQDGPTDAAGAVVTSQLAHELSDDDVHLANTSLDNNDSYSYFSKFRDGAYHVKTGLTGTNIADIQMLFVSFNK